jgi:hypothetical protein
MMRVDPWRRWVDKSLRARRPQQVEQILDAIEHGISIDFSGDRRTPRACDNPKPGTAEDAQKMHEMIMDDVRDGKKAGPFARAPFPIFSVSPVRCVPKKNGKVRVIHNLSHPFHSPRSINSNVREGAYSCSSWGDAAAAVVRFGVGCWLVKLDISAAFKQVPVRPSDWNLLGFHWRGSFYYERVLPFGLKSSPRLWELFASALHHFIQSDLEESAGAVVIHYVDDFLFIAKTQQQAQRMLDGAIRLAEELGIPWADDKTEGPTTCLVFLGVEINTLTMQARLPDTKLLELRELITSWLGKKTASLDEISRLIGKLGFACNVAKAGRPFTQRFYQQQSLWRKARWVKHDTQQAGITPWLREDLEWWNSWIQRWNGVSLLLQQEWLDSPTIELFTDACDTGFGGHFGSSWFAGRWSPAQLSAAFVSTRISMPFLELLALVTAAAIWAPQWIGKRITFRCDAMAVVWAVQARRSNRPALAHLVRELARIACLGGFDFRATHVVGETNVVADILSRHGDCPQFRAVLPRAAAHPEKLPLVSLHSSPMQEGKDDPLDQQPRSFSKELWRQPQGPTM